jgi:uncharacterized protein YigE (DUF2233 family)
VKRAITWLAVCVLAGTGCREPAPQREPKPLVTAQVSVVPTVSASAAGPLTRLRGSEVAAPGLHVESGVLSSAAQWGFTELTVDLGRTELRIVLAKGGAELGSLLSPKALAVVNGGYFEADFRPTTWVVDAGVQLSAKSDTSKGGVFALGREGVYIGAVSGLTFAPRLAVQSFPLVVEPEGKTGVYRDDGRRAARTVACLVGDSLHFIVITAPRGDGPTLFETATLLREPRPSGFGCRRALNLDGGPSSGVWFAPSLQAKQRPPFAKVGYAIAILPR